MLGTLFFDESRVGTAFRARASEPVGSTAPHDSNGAGRHLLANVNGDGRPRLHDGGGLTPAHGCAFGCRGEVRLPSLQASLLWWLDADTSVVRLLAVNDSESSKAARSCQSRLLTVELPVAVAEDLVTCGVTRSYMGDHSVAVVWLRRGVAAETHEVTLCPGFASVTVQRDVDNTGHSVLLLVPDERVVHCAPLSRALNSCLRQCAATASAGSSVACVAAALPDDATPRTISVLVLTDGARVWRVELFADGSAGVGDFRDEPRRNVLRSVCEGNEDVQLLDTRTVVADLQRLSSPAAVPFSTDAAAAADGASAAPRGSTWIRRLLGGEAGGNGRATERGDGGVGGAADAALPSSVRQRLYAAVTAVQHSPFVVLTRWCGQVETYDTAGGTLSLTQTHPIGMLPPTALRAVDDRPHQSHRARAASGAGKSGRGALPPGPVAQWAMLSPTTGVLHVVSCLSGGDGRPCFWTSLPSLAPPSSSASSVLQLGYASDAGEVVAQHCTLSVAPPTQSSIPLACAVTADGRRMVLVSDVGTEEDGHLLCTRSLSALTLRGEQAYEDGVATVVQVMEAAGVTGMGGVLRMSRVHGYLCQGARMQCAVACESEVLLAERGPDTCRLYALEEAAAAGAMRLANETTVVGVDEEDIYASGCGGDRDGAAAALPRVGGALLPLRRVHLVPLSGDATPLPGTATSTTADGADGFALYWEGVSVVQACPHGAQLMSELLQDVLLATTPVAQIASLPRFLSEAHLSGYTSSLHRHASTTTAAVLAAIRVALSPPPTAPLPSPTAAAAGVFYRFSRLHITHATLGELLSRVTFLATAYLGWQSTYSTSSAPPSSSSAGEDDGGAQSISADWVTHQLVAALEVAVAAYHAVPAAGADLVRLAVVDSDGAGHPSCGAIVAGLLPTLPPTPDGGDELSAVSLLQVANRLRRCGTPSTARACAVWVKQLARRFPVLQHYQLLTLLETAAASAQSERALALCERVSQALSREGPADVTTALLVEGLLLADAAASVSTFSRLPVEELSAALAAEPSLGPLLYCVGVLRRTTAAGALHATLSTSVTRRYLYPALIGCVEAVQRMQRRSPTSASAAAPAPFSQLRRALEELQVDVLLVSALARVAEGDVACGLHEVQAALDTMSRHGSVSSYAELLQMILGHVVEVACASQEGMNDLLRTTAIGAAQLEESLILRWYNYIARLPTKSATEATEALRYRAIMGLHRYLMDRHSYAQCARLMSSLATLIRCSPMRRSTAAGISVSELAGLALHAAEMIAPSAPMPEAAVVVAAQSAAVYGAATLDGSLDAAAMVGSPLSLGYSWQPSTVASPAPFDPAVTAFSASARNPRWLTRGDIPWLRRRLYQAHCERQLWRRGCTLDCTDLWVEGAPAEAYEAGVAKLVVALMEARLWPQAFRFARLSTVCDACTVLVEWAVDLLRTPDEHGRAEAAEAAAAHADRTAAWDELIGYCGELSALHNQFYAYVRTVTAALTRNYTQVPAALLAAHRAADAYTATTTLFHVALMLRDQVDAAGHGDDEEDGGASLSAASSTSSSSSSPPRRRGAAMPTGHPSAAVKPDSAALVAMQRNAWRAWCAAAQIAVEVAARPTFSSFTAGVLDPMAVCAREWLATPAYAAALRQIPRGSETVRLFMDILARP
ncbi:hypothetical protein NESM_000106500 [Novymonas esmeraldas]|uniref:Uncharacterized protein n=1 Tax=Novymonas esmeraldas TaxID=1808958 RepID=A0AAW0F4D7_9TRYP